MIYLLVLFPLMMAAMTFAWPSNRWRPWLVPMGSGAQLAFSVWGVCAENNSALDGWLLLDPLGKVFLGFISCFFFLCSLCLPSHLRHSTAQSNRVFCAHLYVFLAMMTLVTVAHHLGLMWVAMEATTLATAPLIWFHHGTRALEATWKYLLICSVGIAVALLGSFFLAYSSLDAGLHSTLLFGELVHQAPQLSPPWLRAAFILLVVGYGTKMGLAPMHTWLPDAHGEAPAPVSALLSGALLPCAFLAILRIFHICHAAGYDGFAREMLMFLGLLSMATAAVFIIRQRDIKRMLAYSSIEHMGILVLSIGLGGAAVFGALLHVLNHGFTKAALFLAAGNISHAYQSKTIDTVRGVMSRLPLSGMVFLAGLFGITGSPPFGPFVSEFTIVNAAFDSGQFLAGGLFLLLLGVAFLGMGATVLAVVQGTAPDQKEGNGFHDNLGTGAPLLLFLALVLLLGLCVPPPLEALLREAVVFLEVKR